MVIRFPIRSIVAAMVLFPSVAAAGEVEDGTLLLLQRLGDSRFAVRQAATNELLKDDSLTLNAICALYRCATHEEQRHRLLGVARHHMLRLKAVEKFRGGRQGVIGIRMQPATIDTLHEPSEPAVRVTAVFAGFPGYVHLRPGDLILRLDRERVADAISFGTLVRKKQPGERIDLTVLREGQRVAVRFKLFDVRAMREMYDVNSSTLRTPRLRDAFGKQWQQLRISLESDGTAQPSSVESRHVSAAPGPAGASGSTSGARQYP